MKPTSPYLEAYEILRRIRRDGGDVDLVFIDPETGERHEATVGLSSPERLENAFKAYQGCEAYVCPELPAGEGVAFLAACLSEASAVDWTGWRAPIVIGKGDSVYAIWPFDEPALRDEALEALFARNAASIDDPVPLPSGSGPTRLEELGDQAADLATLEKYVLKAGTSGPVARRTPSDKGNTRRLCGQGFEVLASFAPDLANREIALSGIPNISDSKPRKITRSLPTMLMTFLSFAEREQKDGTAVVLGHFKGRRRMDEKVIKISALGFDFDGAIDLEAFDEDFAQKALLGVRYTTFSHGAIETRLPIKSLQRHCGGEKIGEDEVKAFLREKKGWADVYANSAQIVESDDEDVVISHDPVAKFRLIVPLEVPITPDALEVEPGKAFATRFKDVIKAAIDALGLTGADESCTNIARLFYVPSVHPDNEASSRLFGGELFDWRTLKLDAVRPVREFRKGARPGKAGSAKCASTRRSATTDMGRRLGPWSAAASESFQVRAFFQDIAAEDIREDKSDKSIIACPFEDDHTDIDPDDTACMAVDPGCENVPIFQINCLHDGCRDYNQLDMLGALIESGKAPVSCLMDRRYYAESVDMARVRAALIKALDGEDERKEAIRDFIDELDDEPTEKCVEEVIELIEASGLGAKARRSLYNTLDDAAGFEINELVVRGAAPSLPDGSRYQFDEPGYELEHEEDGVLWIYTCGDEKKGVSPKPVCAALAVRHNIILVDQDRDVRTEVVFHNGAGGWISVDFDRAILAQPTELLRALSGKGFKFNKPGRSFAPDFIASKSASTIHHFSRAGWRTVPQEISGAGERVFVTPAGETIPEHPQLGLHSAVKVHGDWAYSGSFEEWRRLISDVMSLEGVDHIRAGVLFGLCGPVMDLLGEKSFSVLIEGESRSGKSEGVRLAAGHWAYPDHDTRHGLFIRSNATKNALITNLVRGSGSMFGIDEIGQRDPKDQVDLIFNIEGGQDRARMNRSLELVPTRGWGGMAALMTSETNFAERLRSGEIQPPSGTAARFIPIDAQNARTLSRDELAMIEEAKRHYGHSGPAFVRAMVEAGVQERCEELKERISANVDALTGVDAAPIKKSAVRGLAIMWLVAELVRDLGLIDDVYDIEALVRALYDEAQEYGFKAERPVDRAIRGLLDTIVREKGNRIVASHEDRGHDRIGFYGKEAEAIGVDDKVTHQEVYVLHTNAVEELTAKIVSKNALIKGLRERGLLLRQPGRSQTLNVWRGFPGIAGDNASFVVLSAEKIDGSVDEVGGLDGARGEVIDLSEERSSRF